MYSRQDWPIKIRKLVEISEPCQTEERKDWRSDSVVAVVGEDFLLLETAINS